MGGKAPRTFGFEGQQGLSAGASQDRGKQRLNSWRAHTRIHMHWDPGQSSDTIGPWARATYGPCRVSWESESQLWLTAGARTLVAETPGIFVGVSSPGGHHSGTKTWPDPSACRLQCRDTSGLTTNRVETAPPISRQAA